MNRNFINKLIANDIVNRGINNTHEFNYIVYLDEYTNNIDDESKKYIYDNKDKIKDCILENKNVAALDYDESENSYDMDFYLDSVMDRVERKVYDNAEMLDIDLSISDIRDITEEILDDDEFNEDMISKIKNYKGEYEI